LAKFEDLDKANQQFNDLGNASFTTMPIGDNFDAENGNVIKRSKMDDLPEDDDNFSSNSFNNTDFEEPPF